VPATTPDNTCTNLKQDWLMSQQSSGNPYAVPAIGTITSWSTQTSASPGQVWTMKVYRKVSGTTYRVVGHDGPKPLPPGQLNTFQTNLPVMPGDLIGMNDNDSTTPVSTSCGYAAPGNTTSWHNGSLADGQSVAFTSNAPNSGLNIEANFAADNRFSVGAVARNKKRGTATVTVDLPNPGQLSASAAGTKVTFTGAVSSPGPAQLFVKAQGKKKRKLFRKGRAKVNVAIIYTPAGGDANTQHAKFKLRRR
jgi:hypothetical protein